MFLSVKIRVNPCPKNRIDNPGETRYNGLLWGPYNYNFSKQLKLIKEQKIIFLWVSYQFPIFKKGTVNKKRRKLSRLRASAFMYGTGSVRPYFLNLFLPMPASPIKPVPSSSMVEGSGTGAVVPFPIRLSLPHPMVK